MWGFNSGTKVACPICGKRCMSQTYIDAAFTGLGQHIKQSHGDSVFNQMIKIQNLERDRAELERELHEAFLNTGVSVTRRTLIEIVAVLEDEQIATDLALRIKELIHESRC